VFSGWSGALAQKKRTFQVAFRSGLMPSSATYRSLFHVLLAGIACMLPILGGCKKPASSLTANGTPETIVEFGGTDVNANGTLSEQTLQAIASKSKEPALSVMFYRTQLNDAGLTQLEKFPNIRRVTAVGSAITPAGIEKLKKSIPEVQVSN
jgi:hypothetical protein